MNLNEFQKRLKSDPYHISRRLESLSNTLVEVSVEARALGYSLEELADIACEHGLLGGIPARAGAPTD